VCRSPPREPIANSRKTPANGTRSVPATLPKSGTVGSIIPANPPIPGIAVERLVRTLPNLRAIEFHAHPL